VFQHACQLADGLSRAGKHVVLHTGHQHEEVAVTGVEICTCSWWPRHSSRTAIRTSIRQVAVGARLVAKTLPHLLRTTRRGAVLHVQGVAASGVLNWLTLWAARLCGRRVVYSPHDTFSRRGPVERVLLTLAYQPAHAIMVFSDADKQRLRPLGSRVFFSPLVQLVPQPSMERQLSWRREWRADRSEKVVLFAGFIRPERRLDLLIESARHWPVGRRLAVVGADWGDWSRCAQLARVYDVDIASRIGFVELDQFAAAIAAADVVVVPSDTASQSGVLVLAHELGTAAIAAAVGGMGELACRTFPPGDVEALNRALQVELDNASVVNQRPEVQQQEELAVKRHLCAYGQPA
jgi:glycosyltransferase involved in cell wall biosynthesis